MCVNEYFDTKIIINILNILLYNTEQNWTFRTFIFSGEYFDFDSSGQHHSKSIMADQLCGEWYLKCCGVNEEVMDCTRCFCLMCTFLSNYYVFILGTPS